MYLQIEKAGEGAAALTNAPPLLNEVSINAAAELDTLCALYSLNRNGFAPTVAHQGKVSISSGSSDQAILPMSLASNAIAPLLYPPPSGLESPQQRMEFSEGVLVRFSNKLHGRGCAPTAAATGGMPSLSQGLAISDANLDDKVVGNEVESVIDVNNSGKSVSDVVDELVRKATSVDRLARMFEGWMPWV